MEPQEPSGPDALPDALPGHKESACDRHSTSRPPLKWKRVLTTLLSGQSYNRFEAQRELHDHCLHSTVSTLQAKGVMIYRRTERVPGFMGIPTECCRYWITPESFQRARELLGQAFPLSEAPEASQALYARQKGL